MQQAYGILEYFLRVKFFGPDFAHDDNLTVVLLEQIVE